MIFFNLGNGFLNKSKIFKDFIHSMKYKKSNENHNGENMIEKEQALTHFSRLSSFKKSNLGVRIL
jgi:hypothetical protein